MNLKIFNEEEEKDVRIKLHDCGEVIELRVVDFDGDRVYGGSLLQINKTTGKVYRNVCVNKSLGLPLDEEGRMILEGE